MTSLKFIFSIIFIGLTSISYSQNLVPNPSFEDTIHCPSSFANLDSDCNNWLSFRGTPDYFNSCTSSPLFGFKNGRGYQQAHSGNGYAGYGGFEIAFPANHEQLGVQLVSPLKIQCTYHLKFFISTGYRFYAWNLMCNNIGILFTTQAYQDFNNLFPVINSCTFRFDSLIIDTTNWIEVNYSFVADSSYRYLVIGAFFDNQHTDTITPYPFDDQTIFHGSFFYIDDVSLYKDDLCDTSIVEMPNVFTPNHDGLNDFFTPKKIERVKEGRLEIYNRWGSKVYETTNLNLGWDGTFNNSECSSGVYFWIVNYTDASAKNYELKGFLSLIR